MKRLNTKALLPENAADEVFNHFIQEEKGDDPSKEVAESLRNNKSMIADKIIAIVDLLKSKDSSNTTNANADEIESIRRITVEKIQ